MDPHASGSLDSDHDYEHLDHPDPHEFEQYHSSVRMSKMSDHHETSPVHVSKDPEHKGFGDYVDDMREKGKEVADNIAEKGHEYMETAKDTSHDYLEQTKDYLQQAKEKGEDLSGNSQEKASEYLFETNDKPHELREHVDLNKHEDDYLHQAQEKGQNFMEEAKNRGHDLLDLAQDRGNELSDFTKDKGHEFAGTAKEYLNEGQHKLEDLSEQFKDKGHEVSDNARDHLNEGQQKIEDLVDINTPEDTHLPEDIKDDHHHIEQSSAPKQIIDDLFNDPPMPQEHHKETPNDPSPVHHDKSPSPKHDDHKDVQDNIMEEIPPPVRHSPLTHDEEDRSHIEAGIEDAVNDTHDEVDAILERLRSKTPEEQNSPSGDSERDEVGKLIGEHNESQIPVSDSLSGMRDVSPDEQTFDRRGPLTIPEHTSTKQDEPSAPPAEDDFEQLSPHSHFDDMEPRPPTPPKDLNDDDVQPEALDLGPPLHEHKKSQDSGLKPILKHSGKPWFDFKTVDPKVMDILYWRDPKKSGIALGVILTTLFLVAKFSLVSLLAYGSLAVLVGTLGFRIFKIVEAKIQKTDASHPFQDYLQKDLEVPQDRVHAQVDVLVENGRNVINQLRRLFLVENVCDSVKFGLLLWTLTYIGAWFSGFALVILFVLGCFSVPKVYEIYKEPIDANLALVKDNLDKVHNTVAEKLPFLNCQAPSQQKKEE